MPATAATVGLGPAQGERTRCHGSVCSGQVRMQQARHAWHTRRTAPDNQARCEPCVLWCMQPGRTRLHQVAEGVVDAVVDAAAATGLHKLVDVKASAEAACGRGHRLSDEMQPVGGHAEWLAPGYAQPASGGGSGGGPVCSPPAPVMTIAFTSCLACASRRWLNRPCSTAGSRGEGLSGLSRKACRGRAAAAQGVAQPTSRVQGVDGRVVQRHHAHALGDLQSCAGWHAGERKGVCSLPQLR